MTGVAAPRVRRDARRFDFGRSVPAAEVSPDELVVVETEDCFSGLITSADQRFASDADILDLVGRFNPVTGPLVVPEAHAGDVVAVTIHQIELAPETGRAVNVVTADMDTVCGRPMQGRPPEPHTSVAQVDGASLLVQLSQRGSLRLPVRPMIGSLGVAPAHGSQSSLLFSAAWGGNLDCAGLGAGSSLYLPVNVDGAFLALGDVHAAMGDAEVTSTAYETSADVTLSVAVYREGELELATNALWLDTVDEIGAVGCEFGASLEANFAHAFTAVRARLEQAYDLSSGEVWAILGVAASARPNQCVHGGWTSTYVGLPRRVVDQLPARDRS
jgi:amidase